MQGGKVFLLCRFAILLLLTWFLAACGRNALPPETPTPSPSSPTPQIGVSLTTLAPPTAVIRQTTPTPLPTPTLTPTPTPILYVIEAGDTLLGIAIAQGTTTEEILALNPDIRPEALQIGQGIVLPQPTAVPLAALESLPLDVEVSQIHAYQTAVGSVWFLGEVTNKGEAPVENVQVEINLLDKRGESLTAALVWTAVPIIQPGASSPFGVLLNEPPPFVQPSVAVVGGQVVAELGNRYLDLAALDTAVTNTGDRVVAVGRVQNVGELTAVAVTLAATFYNEQGEIVGFGLIPLPDPLAPGEARPFT
ncbi:MAG: LysM peptidoglycan-binding domain-containing protein, partial [Chloroflexi bacterium]|nr:LysM peptidoglycan-binding domain-containing protein [Chloroflexota bacterium]